MKPEFVDQYAKTLTAVLSFLRERTPKLFLTLEKKSRHLLLIRHTEIGLIISASLVGICVGLAIVVFHRVMEIFEAGFNLIYEASEQTVAWSVIAIPLICMLGGLSVGILNKFLFDGIDDEGLKSLVRDLKLKDGVMPKRTAIKAMLNASISISSGGGAGREAPTIMLGASVASTIGQFLLLRKGQMRILVVAGSAAAISGIFNAPLGGLVFALEGIVGQTTLRSFVPIVVASVLSTAVARVFFGNSPLLLTPTYHAVQLSDYFLLALAGISSALVAIYYLKVFSAVCRWTKEHSQRFNPIVRPALGGLATGVLLMFLPTLLETSYQPINQALSGNGVVWVAIATICLKPVSNALTIASGGAGGTLAPAMKVGAMFGFCFGFLLQKLGVDTSIGLYALVCAAAVLAGTYAMPLSGAVILFEISHNYDLILPLLFTSVFASFMVRRSKIETFNPIQNAGLGDEKPIKKVERGAQLIEK